VYLIHSVFVSCDRSMLIKKTRLVAKQLPKSSVEIIITLSSVSASLKS